MVDGNIPVDGCLERIRLHKDFRILTKDTYVETYVDNFQINIFSCNRTEVNTYVQ